MIVLRQLKQNHQHLFINALQRTSFRTFSTANQDYYDILGIKPEASNEEIRNAYSQLAKKYHPNVTITDEFHQPDANKFRDITEAYSVLSQPESRLLYDIEKKKFPEQVFRAQKEAMQKLYTQRDEQGNIKKEPYPQGSYAQFKQQWLAEERKKFNVDHLGRYKGGVPQKGKGSIRGGSLGEPSRAHDQMLHNFKNNPDPEEQFVTKEDATGFKVYQNEDRHFIKRKTTWFEADVDYEYFKFKAYATGLRWFRNGCLLLFGISFLAELWIRRVNRELLKSVKNLSKSADLTNGVQVHGIRIKQGTTGIIKIAN